MKALFALGVVAVLAVPVVASKEGPSRPASRRDGIDGADRTMKVDGPFNPPTPAPVADGPFNPPSPAPVADGPFNPPSPAPVADGPFNPPSPAPVA
jgi:hypothetical protein